ncbi:MAG: hypothetical protein K6E40_00780 [Desulfovibrio sp.]|nr:hypothetical protein [Desulfovibrio sp.]
MQERGFRNVVERIDRGFPSAPQAETYPFLRLVKMRKLAFMHHATVAGHQPPAVDGRRFLDPRIACDEEHRFSLEGWQGDMPVKKCIGQHVNRVGHIHAAPGASGRACGMLGEAFLEQAGINATAGYPARALPVGVKQGFRICLGAPNSMPLNEQRPVPVFEWGVPADAKVRPGCALVHRFLMRYWPDAARRDQKGVRRSQKRLDCRLEGKVKAKRGRHPAQAHCDKGGYAVPGG